MTVCSGQSLWNYTVSGERVVLDPDEISFL
jgi:hypothetical protein